MTDDTQNPIFGSFVGILYGQRDFGSLTWAMVVVIVVWIEEKLIGRGGVVWFVAGEHPTGPWAQTIDPMRLMSWNSIYRNNVDSKRRYQRKISIRQAC